MITVGQLTVQEVQVIQARRTLAAGLRSEGQARIAAADQLDASVHDFVQRLLTERGLPSNVLIADDGSIQAEPALSIVPGAEA
jgi:uncharacterized protein involved in type VI secretion and phage assembly